MPAIDREQLKKFYNNFHEEITPNWIAKMCVETYPDFFADKTALILLKTKRINLTHFMANTLKISKN